MQINQSQKCRLTGISPDERRGDCVYTAELPVKDYPLHYLFTKDSGAGQKSEFKAFDRKNNPLAKWHTRLFFPSTDPDDYASPPLNKFGVRPLMKEKIHPNRRGHKLLADFIFPRVAEVVRATNKRSKIDNR